MAPALRSRPLNRSELPKAINNPKAPVKSVLFPEPPPGKAHLVPNIRSLSWSPTGSMIATSNSATIRIWDPERANAKLSTEIRNGHNGSFAGGPGGPASSVEKVAFCPSMENVLASTGNDGGVRLWDVRMPGSGGGAGAVGKGTQLADCRLGDSGISMVWHPDGRAMVVGTKEDYVKVVDVRRMTDYGAGAVASWEMECSDRTPEPKKRVHGMAFSNSGHELFITTGEGPVKVLDYPSLQQIHTLSGHSDATYCVAHSPQGSYIAVGGADSIVSLWDTSTWHCSHMLTDHTSAVRDLSFSFDGTFLTVGSMADSKDGSKGLEIYHVDSGEVAHTVDTTNPVTASAWHPLRYWVAFTGDPGGMKILGAGSSL